MRIFKWLFTIFSVTLQLCGLFSIRSLVVHGFVLDEEGKKMSKSVGNVVDPAVVIDGGKVNNFKIQDYACNIS